MHPRQMLEPLELHRARVMKAVGKRWNKMPDVTKQTWIDKAVLERDVATIRQDPLATYVNTMSDANAVETTGTPWGLPDCEYPVAEANVIKAMSAASKRTGPRKVVMRQYSEAWHQEHGFFIDSRMHTYIYALTWRIYTRTWTRLT